MHVPAMNTTKWDVLRLEMCALTPPPTFRVLCKNGYRSPSDREWYHHFSEGGYEDNVHVDIQTKTSAQIECVRTALKKIHVPGQELSDGFRVFGYLGNGQSVEYV